MKTITEVDEFKSLFKFNPMKSLYIGCEREIFLGNSSGVVSPLAPDVLSHGKYDWLSYELSACQLEYHIGPAKDMTEFKKDYSFKESKLMSLLNFVNARPIFETVMSEDMPLDVYPDPTGRYQEITRHMPKDILLSACRITGTHFHVGMPDHETALRVYNSVVKNQDALLQKGDLTHGVRLKIYESMAKDYYSKSYDSWGDMYNLYKEKDCTSDPRQCWHLIRISVHGTIEFRMFDNTQCSERVFDWAQLCLNLCRRYM